MESPAPHQLPHQEWGPWLPHTRCPPAPGADQQRPEGWVQQRCGGSALSFGDWPCRAAPWARKGSLVHVAGEGQQVRSGGCSQQGRSAKLSWGACMFLPFLGLVSAQASPGPSLSTSPGCFQPNLELFPGKAEGRRRAKPAVEAAWGCSGDAVPCRAEHGLFPSKLSHGQGDWEPGLLCLVTNYLGAPWASRSPP